MRGRQIITTIRIPSELGYEKVAMASAAIVAMRMGFSPARVDDVKTVVSEACVNAMEHGNGMDAASPVVIELAEDATGLEISVSDVGRKRISFPTQGTDTGNPYRGWGMFLIQSLVDEFEFDSTLFGGNTIRMRLHFTSAAGRSVISQKAHAPSDLFTRLH